MASNVYYWAGGFLKCKTYSSVNQVWYTHLKEDVRNCMDNNNGVNYTDADAYWAKKNDNGDIESYEVSFTRCTPKMRCTYHDTILDEGKYGTDDAIRVINDTTDIWSINIDDGESCIMTAYENPSSGTLPSYNVPTDVHTIYGIAEFHFIPEFYNNSSITPTSETAVGEWEYLTPLATRNGMFEGTSIITCQLPCKIGKISSETFRNCQYLTSYTETPDFLVEIGNNAFDGCTSLPKITLGKFVRALGEDAFKGCSSAETIWWSGLNNDGTGLCCLDTIPSGCFSGCGNLRNTSFGMDDTNVKTNQLIIPDGIKTIGSSAFAHANEYGQGITSMTFAGSTVQTIGDNAFSNFGKMSTPFNISGFSSVTSIGQSAFNASAVQKIDKTSNVTSMGKSAFKFCDKLVDFDFSGMTVIPSNAFNGAVSLSSITNYSNITEIGDRAFFSGVSLSSSMVMNFNKCTKIGEEAFGGCSKISYVNLSGITEVPFMAFDGCSNLKTINLSKCEKVYSYAFNGCSSLTGISLPKCTSFESNPEINFYGHQFSNCTSLKSANISAVTSLTSYAFEGCTSLSSVSLNNCDSISQGAFKGCSSLSSITISASSIGNSVFYDCTNLKTVLFNKNFSAESYTFNSNSGVETIRIMATVTNVSGNENYPSFKPIQNANLTVQLENKDVIVSGVSELFALDTPMKVKVASGKTATYSSSTEYNGAVWTWQEYN